jgi:succinate dehydrogenase / fumarate reductase cytochrome b subunit
VTVSLATAPPSPSSTPTPPARPEARPPLAGPTYFLLRRLHSLTGIIFGGYLVVHLIVNATIVQLGGIYQLQVDKIHHLPLMWALEWGFIYLPIIYHTIYGIWIIVTGQPNVGSYPYHRNWSYTLQRISAVIIVLFIIFHVFALKYGLFGPSLAFDEHHAAASVHAHLTDIPVLMWIIYPLGILASCYHLANGFWTAAITWGLTVSAGAQRRWGWLCGIFFVVMLVLGMTAFVGGFFMTPPPPTAPTAQVAV